MGVRLHPSQFQPIREVGRGGTGLVWEVRHLPTGMSIALKLLRSDIPASGAVSLQREVRAQRVLHHPRVLPVLGFGQGRTGYTVGSRGLAEGRLWSAYEFLERGSLIDQEKPLTSHGLRTVLLRVLDALAHCHARDLVHLDIKPDNLLVRDDPTDVVLADFGLAKAIGRATEIAGTPNYMAPEQITGGSLDPRTDLYALGCTAYHLATRRPPFAGSVSEICEAQQNDPLPPTGDAGFDQWLQRMTAKRPADRFPSAASAAAALAPFELPNRPPGVITQMMCSTLDLEASPSRPTDRSGREAGGMPLPKSWSLPEHTIHHVLNAGLGELGIRQAAFVGRTHARDQLWIAARRVAEQRRAELLVVSGPEGVGCTRLVDWFGRRLRELDCADTYRRLIVPNPTGPLQVCLLDDVPPSQLAQLRRQVADASGPLLVVVVARNAVADVELAPLPHSDMVSLAHALVGLHADDAGHVATRARGLPGHLVWELTERARGDGLELLGGSVRLVGDVPRPHEQLTQAEAEVVQLLTWFEPVPTAALLAMAPGPDALMALLDRGWVHGDPVVRGARCPEADLSEEEERAILTRAAGIAPSVHVAALTGDLQGIETGLNEARRLTARQAAAIRDALPSTHPWSARVSLLECLGALHVGEHLRAVELADEALARTLPPGQRAGLMGARAQALSRLGGGDDVRVDQLEAASLSGATELDRLAWAMGLAMVRLRQSDFEAALAACEPWDDVDDVTIDMLMAVRRAVLGSMGRLEEALAVSDRLLARTNERPMLVPVALMLMAEAGRVDEAIELGQRAQARPLEPQRSLATCMAYLHLLRGEWDEVRALAYEDSAGFSTHLRLAVLIALHAGEIAAPFDPWLAQLEADIHNEPAVYGSLHACLQAAIPRADGVGLVDRTGALRDLAERLAELDRARQAHLETLGNGSSERPR